MWPPAWRSGTGDIREAAEVQGSGSEQEGDRVGRGLQGSGSARALRDSMTQTHCTARGSIRRRRPTQGEPQSRLQAPVGDEGSTEATLGGAVPVWGPRAFGSSGFPTRVCWVPKK